MNNLYTWRQFVPAKLFAVFTIVSLVLSAFPAAFFVAEAQELDEGEFSFVTNGPPPPVHEKIDICHWSPDDSMFVMNSPNKTADAGGHARHHDGKDIIPAFDYPAKGQTPAGTFTGQNLDTVYDGMTGAEWLGDKKCPPPLTGSIYGEKFQDLDGNGKSQEEGEPELEDWTIRLYDAGGDVWVLFAEDVTDEFGEYAFKDVPEGEYRVCEVMKEDWTQTFVTTGTTNLSPKSSEEGDKCQTVNIDDYDDDKFTRNFGNYYDEPVDVCPNIKGYQEEVPKGYVLDDGECVPMEKPVCDIGENLLDNGSFEDPVIKKDWVYTSITDWIITALDDDAVQDGELHRGWSGNQAAHGEQYAELDSRESVRMSQTVATTPGATYELKWAFAPRHNLAAEQNQLAVLIDDSVVMMEGPATGAAGLTQGDWKRGNYVFTADDETTVAFEDAGPSDSLGTFLDDTALCLVREPVPELTVHTSKIVCEDEADLPNWGAGGPDITETTATDWVSEHKSCELVKGWEFEWAPFGTGDPGDTLTGPAGGDWTTFTGSVTIPVPELDGKNKFWMREVLQDGYIPFTHEFSGNSDDYTAEFYCHTDVLNYDNYDRIDGVQEDADYYCVGWNVPVEKPPVCELKIVSDDTNYVVERDADAVELSFVHPNWVQSLVDSFWIWGDDGPVDPSAEETQNFIKQFGVNPAVTVTDATLKIASDNQFEADLNGSFNVDDNDGNNFSALQTYDVTSDILAGNNELAVEVVNLKGSSNPEANPAGLYYELVITGEGAEECGVPYEPEPEPYCGDGEVNQEWEMCDGTEGCTDYCTWDNQCTDLKLAKIDFTQAPDDSVSFDETIILGAEGKTTPAGYWFNLDDVENGDLHDLAKDNEGLVLSNDGSSLGFAVWGGNPNNKFDYAFADIHFKGLELGTVNDTNAVVNWPLETSGWVDVFDKDGNEKITMEWYLTTGGDAASVAYTMGEEYDCPECLATVEARVLVDDYGTAGAGDLSDEIVLGDAGYTTVGFGEWFPISLAPAPGESAVMINDPNTVTNFANPGDKPGLFVSREDGTVKVALYGEHSPGGATNNEWIDARIEVRDAEITNFSKLTGGFKFENHNGNVPSNEGYDEATADGTGVDFKMWVDTASDGFKFDITEIDFCEDDTEEEYLIDGYKYEGEYERKNETVSGWPIHLYSGDEAEPTMSTTTDEEGYYYFWVGEGEWRIEEGEKPGWYQVGVNDGGDYEYTEDEPEFCYVELPYEVDDYPIFNSIALILDDVEYNYSDYRCDFYNERDESYYIDGYKFAQESDFIYGVPGWTIELRDSEGELVTSTTTDENGYYWFDGLVPGYYEVHEVMPSGWFQTSVSASGGYSTDDFDVNYCVFEFGQLVRGFQVEQVTAFISDDYQESGYSCDFYNEEEEETITTTTTPRGGSSSGTRVNRATPQVAGASTDFCPFIEDYMQIGWDNDRWEVTKLQMFLKLVMGYNVEVTGEFDLTTDVAVKLFQALYHGEVIAPWFERGIVPHNEPTGFVYKTTRWKINDIICPGVEPYPSFDGEDLTSNIDID